MKVLSLERDNYKSILRNCKSALEGTPGFIIIPTETVYGLASLWDNEIGRNCIYKAKARPEYKPFQMLVENIDMAKRYGCIVNSSVAKIVRAFCPGPITIVVSTFSGSKIGFRIPEYAFVIDLISFIGKPLAASSANLSGEKPALNIATALFSIKIRPALAVDGGKIPESSCASTVVEVVDSNIRVLREGPISLSAILEVLE